MNNTVLFLCPHNAAKSVLAAAYFNQLAERSGLPYVADSAGTEPSDAVLPVVVTMLGQQGLDVKGYRPRHVSAEELQNAAHVVSMGCGTAKELGVEGRQVEQWDNLPVVSQNPEQERDAIQARVEQLVADLRAS